MKKIIFISVLIFLSSCGYTPTTSPLVIESIATSPPPQQNINGPVVKFLNWNIHKEGNEQEWLNDILVGNCTKDPDITLFQEAKLDVGLKYALKVKNLGWKFVPNAILDGEYVGVLTASKSKSLFNIPLVSPGREPITETPKVALITSYNVSTNGTNLNLLVANIHGMNFVDQVSFENQLSLLNASLLPHVGTKAIIVSGDFNTWSSKRISTLNNYMSRLSLVEVPLTNITTPPWYAWIFPVIEKTTS